MDTELLVENRIDDGHRLLIELAREGVDITIAAWVKTSEEGRWFLYIGSGMVEVGTLANVYRTVYACLRRVPISWVEMSEVKLIPAANPIARELLVIRDRYSDGRLPTRYGGKRLGNVAIEEAYIYPRITTGLTREEVIQTVTGLMSRAGVVRPSTLTLRDGRVINGIPYGLEMSRSAGQPAVLQVKILNDVDGSTHIIPADEVTNIQ